MVSILLKKRSLLPTIVDHLSFKNNWFKVENYPSAAIRIGKSFAPIFTNQTIGLSFFGLPLVYFRVFGPTIKETHAL